MRVSWTDILDTAADALDGKKVELRGWPATAEPAATAAYLLLTPEPVCCAGCLPSDPLRCVEVFANDPLPLGAGPLRLRGCWRRLVEDPNGWRYQLTDARTVTEGLARRPAFPGIGGDRCWQARCSAYRRCAPRAPPLPHPRMMFVPSWHNAPA